jgi:hypothetical protein
MWQLQSLGGSIAITPSQASRPHTSPSQYPNFDMTYSFSGDVPARHSENDPLRNRCMHPPLGAVVKIGASFPDGLAWGSGLHDSSGMRL